MSFLPKPKNPHWFLYGYIWAALYYFVFTWITGKFVDPALFAAALIYSEATFLFGYYNKLPIFWFGFIGMVIGFASPNFRNRLLFWIIGIILGVLIMIFRKYYSP